MSKPTGSHAGTSLANTIDTTKKITAPEAASTKDSIKEPAPGPTAIRPLMGTSNSIQTSDNSESAQVYTVKTDITQVSECRNH